MSASFHRTSQASESIFDGGCTSTIGPLNPLQEEALADSFVRNASARIFTTPESAVSNLIHAPRNPDDRLTQAEKNNHTKSDAHIDFDVQTASSYGDLADKQTDGSYLREGLRELPGITAGYLSTLGTTPDLKNRVKGGLSGIVSFEGDTNQTNRNDHTWGRLRSMHLGLNAYGTKNGYVRFEPTIYQIENFAPQIESKLSIAGAMGRHLYIGEKVEVTLNVADKSWESGIVVSPGEKYEINATGSWSDGDLPACGPGGFLATDLEWWRRPIFGAARFMRPVNTGSRWCSLIAGVGNGKFEEIGSRLPAVIETKRPGSLKFSVNDVRFENNKGSLQISIRRISEP